MNSEFKVLDFSLSEDGTLLVVTYHCLRPCAGFAGIDSHYKPNSTACTSAGAFRAWYATDGEAALLQVKVCSGWEMSQEGVHLLWDISISIFHYAIVNLQNAAVPQAQVRVRPGLVRGDEILLLWKVFLSICH